MALHFARSDRSKGRRKEGHDQIVFAVIVTEIADQPIMGGGERKVQDLFTHQRFFLLRRKPGDGSKKEKNKKQPEPFQKRFPSHVNLLDMMRIVASISHVHSARMMFLLFSLVRFGLGPVHRAIRVVWR